VADSVVTFTTSGHGAQPGPRGSTAAGAVMAVGLEFQSSSQAMGSAALCEQWLGLHRLPYPSPSAVYGPALPPLGRGSRWGSSKVQGFSSSSHMPSYLGMSSSTSVSGHSSFRASSSPHRDEESASDALVVRG